MQDNISFLPRRQAPGETEWTVPNNLPGQLTPFIGRELEVAAVSALLRRPEVRLLTLTGTGGVGKTRLALEVVSMLLHDYPDGVYFVSLAPISDPELVIPTIAHTLDLWEARDQSLVEYLQAYLKKRKLLLLLDNFEQIIEAGSHLAELLQACPELTILVTSRAALRLYGEQEYSVPTLAVPDLKHLPALEELSQYAAVALFIQQAQAVKPDFRLTRENAPIIAEICMRLDGLALALELAASRIKLLPPRILLQRLEHRLSLLTGGARNLPPRQQALRNTIAWSYDLLNAAEQRLFRRLAVFTGGCTLEAIEAISSALGDAATEVLAWLDSLVDKSLLQQSGQEGDEARLVLLETIREYALEQLMANGEEGAARQVHADYYLQLAEAAAPRFGGPQQAAWLERLERENDNLFATLHWLVEQGEQEGNSQALEMVLRLCVALREFWNIHDHSREALSFLERALVKSQHVTPSLRARALSTAAHMAFIHDSYKKAQALAEEGLLLLRELGDSEGIALTLHHLERIARATGDYDTARLRIMESLELWRSLGNIQRIGWSLFRLARQFGEQGEYAEAHRLFQESLSIFRKLEYQEGIAYTLFRQAELLFLARDDLDLVRALLKESLALMKGITDKGGENLCYLLAGRIALLQGDSALARSLFEDCLATSRQLGYATDIAEALQLLAGVAAAQGSYAEAGRLYHGSLELFQEAGDKWYATLSLVGLASVLVEEPLEVRWLPENMGIALDHRTAALLATRLCGLAESLFASMKAPLPPVERPTYDRTVATARAHLGEAAFARAWAEGQRLALEQALSPLQEADTRQEQVAKVLQPAASQPSLSTFPAGLTSREVEILRLVAQGLTDARVAEQLVISPRTVNWHLTTIYSKLGVSSRAAATRFAIEHGLV